MIPKHISDTKYPLGSRAVGCLFSQTPPLLLPADAKINLLRCHIGAWRQARGEREEVWGWVRGKDFFPLCKHPVSSLTSLTGGKELKKNPTHRRPASLEKFLASPHSIAVTFWCWHRASEPKQLCLLGVTALLFKWGLGWGLCQLRG